MTDRINGCVVSFDAPIRIDDAEPILTAIRMIKGVDSVSTDLNVFDVAHAIERERVRRSLVQVLLDHLKTHTDH